MTYEDLYPTDQTPLTRYAVRQIASRLNDDHRAEFLTAAHHDPVGAIREAIDTQPLGADLVDLARSATRVQTQRDLSRDIRRQRIDAVRAALREGDGILRRDYSTNVHPVD